MSVVYLYFACVETWCRKTWMNLTLTWKDTDTVSINNTISLMASFQADWRKIRLTKYWLSDYWTISKTWSQKWPHKRSLKLLIPSESSFIKRSLSAIFKGLWRTMEQGTSQDQSENIGEGFQNFSLLTHESDLSGKSSHRLLETTPLPALLLRTCLWHGNSHRAKNSSHSRCWLRFMARFWLEIL